MQLNIAEFPVPMLVHIVSDLLESIIRTNDELMIGTPLTHFHSRAKPGISIYAYLTRILKFAPFSNEALLSLLVYFDRIATKKQYAVNSLNVHRLLITSVVIASKFTSDVYYPNSRYAKVGGLPLLELNQLELEFLFLCDFQLHVSLEDLQEYGDQLLDHAVSKSFFTSNTTTTTKLTKVAAAPLSSPPMEQQPALKKSSTPVITHSKVMGSFSPQIERRQKRPYQQPLPLAQKRFCPSPPYTETEPRAAVSKSKNVIGPALLR